jgi:hypothetical protein
MAVILLLWMISCGVSSAERQELSMPENAAPPPAPKAARSVHLFYQAPDAVMYYNEVTVEQSCKGSYFSVCGFSHGYFGLQERNNDKVIIFSVWDPVNYDRPDEVPSEQRVKLLYKDADVEAGRFGGEGTGGQSFLKYDWTLSKTYKFLITAKVSGDYTDYSAYFYLDERNCWKHLATFSRMTHGEVLKGYYSFIEDFRRDFKSVMEVRRARFTNGWIKTSSGNWISLTKAKFTADSTALMTINAGTIENGFFLQTGGETLNETPLWSDMERLPGGLTLPEKLVSKTSHSAHPFTYCLFPMHRKLFSGDCIWKAHWIEEIL